MEEYYSIFYKIKELERNVLKNLTKPMINNQEKNRLMCRPTPTQMRIVNFILNNIDKKDIYQKDIEEALKLSKATVSDVINRMEKNKLIERKTNPNDTRSKIIILSKNTKELFELNKKKLQELEKKAGKNITQKEFDIFTNILDRMIQNLEIKQN